MQDVRQHPEFVSLGELAQEHGMPEKTLRRRIRRWKVATFEDPWDLRRVLVRRAEAAGLFQPRQIRSAGEATIAA